MKATGIVRRTDDSVIIGAGQKVLKTPLSAIAGGVFSGQVEFYSVQQTSQLLAGLLNLGAVLPGEDLFKGHQRTVDFMTPSGSFFIEPLSA